MRLSFTICQSQILLPHLAAGDAELVEEFEFAPELGAGDFAAEELAVFGDGAGDFFGSFGEEFDAEVAHAEGEQTLHELGAGLGLGIEDGVAAAGIGLERVFGADAVAEFYFMFVTGAAAIPVIFALGQEGAKDAVLHVKHGHVLVDSDLEPFGRGGLQQGIELQDVEIVAGGEAFEVGLILEIFGGEAVGDVQGEIADAAGAGEKLQVIVIADEIAIGIGGADLVENPLFAHFEDARRGDEDAGAVGAGVREGTAVGGVESSDSFAIALGVLEFAINRFGAALEGGFELRLVADEDD